MKTWKNELRTCAFCGQVLTSKINSKEHVWPKWLQKRLGVDNRQFEGIHTGIPWGIHTISTRVQSGNSLVLGAICTSCNSGWMSELESKIAPIFEKLWDTSGTSRYIVLDQQACETIAHWTFKTALVLNKASNYRKIVPAKHFTEFYEKKQLPKNSAVDLSLAPYVQSLQWIQSQSAIGRISGDIEITKEMAKLISTLYVITLDIGGILLRTVWVPTDFLKATSPNGGNIKRLWPCNKPVKLSLVNRKNEMGKFHVAAEFHSPRTA
jgi:hypothetical protein